MDELIIQAFFEDFEDVDPNDITDDDILIITNPIEVETPINPLTGEPADVTGYKRVARKGDRIIHRGRTGVIIQGSPDTLTNDRGTARVGDKVICRKRRHGVQTIVEGASKTLVNDKPMARKTDSCSCGAKINQGSHNTVEGS